MKNKAPVAMVSVALVAVALALLASTDGEPTPLPSPDALPDSGCHATGRVLDAAGAPLPGTSVRARILSPGTAHETPTVTTGTDGSFRLRLFPERGRWALLVQPPGRPAFTAPDRIEARPDRVIEVEIREPDTPVAVDAPPNVTGEVQDSEGRLLTGIPLIVTDGEGEVLTRGTSAERGRVAFLLKATPPLLVYAESLEGTPCRVDRLPCHDVELIVDSPATESDELMVDFRLPGSVPNEMARIRFYDNLGQEILTVNRPVREGPHPIHGIPYGTYDIRVSLSGLAGAIQGFDFRPDLRLAVVTLAATGTVLGSVNEDSRVILFSRSPSMVPVSREFRESDGAKCLYRGAWEDAKGVRRFSFAGLPAGKYRLRILATGHESLDRSFSLAAGEARDFGKIDLVPATGQFRITITDRADVPEDLEYRYIVRLYEIDGHSFTKEVGPGSDCTVEFTDLPAGSWMWRAERILSREEGTAGAFAESTRRVGWDHPVPLLAGEKKSATADCTWRFE